MMKHVEQLITGVGAVGLLLGIAQAETVYVDQQYGPGGDGTAGAPYDTIQAAIDDPLSSEVVVYPGTYSENLVILKSIKILGYDGPQTTRVEAAATGKDVVSIGRGQDVWITGLTLSSGDRGVYQPTSGTLHLRNCVVCGNTSHGIYVERTERASTPDVFIDNCICVINGASGLYIYRVYTGGDHLPNIRAFNNIFLSNERYGVESNITKWGGHGYKSGIVELDYNDYVGNKLGNYNGLFGPGEEVSAGEHSFSLVPGFVGGPENSCNQDFRLIPDSPCKHAGHPGLGWLNPDGSRNDLGAYGGPGARTFYTNPNDGPIVRSVTIDQSVIPRGGTFTIRATGAVR